MSSNVGNLIWQNYDQPSDLWVVLSFLNTTYNWVLEYLKQQQVSTKLI